MKGAGTALYLARASVSGASLRRGDIGLTALEIELSTQIKACNGLCIRATAGLYVFRKLAPKRSVAAQQGVAPVTSHGR